MEALYAVLVVAHLVGMAAIVGGWLTVLRSPRVTASMRHGATAQLLTGLALTGIASADLAGEGVDNTLVGIKLVVALVVAGLAHAGARRTVPAAWVHAIGALAVVNTAVAVLW